MRKKRGGKRQGGNDNKIIGNKTLAEQFGNLLKLIRDSKQFHGFKKPRLESRPTLDMKTKQPFQRIPFNPKK